MDNLKLKDGTILEGASAGLADGFLWLWIPGMTMQEASMIAFDPSKTGKIVYHYGDEMDDTYDGFSVCTNLMKDGDEIAVCLVRE